MKPTPHHQQLVSKCLGKFLVSPFGDGRSFECHQVSGEVLFCRGWGHAIGHDIRLDPARLAEFESKGWTWQDSKPEVDYAAEHREQFGREQFKRNNPPTNHNQTTTERP